MLCHLENPSCPFPLLYPCLQLSQIIHHNVDFEVVLKTGPLISLCCLIISYISLIYLLLSYNPVT